jgi:hypothetical protein
MLNLGSAEATINEYSQRYVQWSASNDQKKKKTIGCVFRAQTISNNRHSKYKPLGNTTCKILHTYF